MRVFLHGFGGRSSDFNFENRIAEGAWIPELTLESHYWNLGLWDLARVLNRQIREFGLPVRLVGYSMGGRIAWHMLLLEPALFRSAVIVSANVGLATAEERDRRLEWETLWAHKWQTLSPELAWSEWKKLEVFGPSKGLSWGPELGLDRWKDVDPIWLSKRLSLDMRFRGLSRQDNLALRIPELKVPTLAITGSHDKAYTDQLPKLRTLSPNIQTEVVKGSGHRLLWEKPLEFFGAVRSFESSTNS
jgi:2-succinyl-6-hydroxy-2,4-cyclohexadiene-1-carboxylate synthase